MKRQIRGQIQRAGERPTDFRAVVDDNDPLTYKIRHLNVSSSSGTLTLNLAEANSFACTLTENITTIDINGPFVADEFWEFELALTQAASGGPYTVTAPASFKYPNGAAWTMSSTASQRDRLYGRTIDGATTWDVNFSNNYS